jgi:hypothetical protein
MRKAGAFHYSSKAKRGIKKRKKFSSNSQKFHGKSFSNAGQLNSNPSGELVTLDEITYYKKTPIKSFLKPDNVFVSHLVNDPVLSQTINLAESIVLRGIWRIYSRLLRKGAFKRIDSLGQGKFKVREYFLRPLKLLRVNKSHFLAEFLAKPNVRDLLEFIRNGTTSQGETADRICAGFIKENNLTHYLGSDNLRRNLSDVLYSVSEQTMADLRAAGREFKRNAAKKGLNSSFALDFEDARRNIIVESVDKNGRFNFVFIDPVIPSGSVKGLPSVARTKKRSKQEEFEAKHAGQKYDFKGHSKRRKQN